MKIDFIEYKDKSLTLLNGSRIESSSSSSWIRVCDFVVLAIFLL